MDDTALSSGPSEGMSKPDEFAARPRDRTDGAYRESAKGSGAPARPLSHIAIFGSCVTRDAFGDRPEDYGVTLAPVIMRSGILSAQSRPFNHVDVRFEEATKFELRCARTDIEKTALAQLAAAAPDWIIVDLIDERFDLALAPDGAFATASKLATERSDLWQHRDKGIVRVPRAWSGTQRAALIKAADWLEGIKSVVPERRIVIHRAFWANVVRDAHGALKPEASERAAFIEATNRRLEELYDRLHSLAPEAQSIEVGVVHRVADANHRWGPAPFHYVESYYREFELILERALASSARTALQLSASGGSRSSSCHPRPPAPLHDESVLLAQLVDRALGGDADLAFRLGRSLLDDGLFSADHALAFELLCLAALLGHADAVAEVGVCLTEGIGVLPDPDLGLQWLRQADLRGVAKAKRVLGDYYLDGKHVPLRHDLARIYFRRAAEAGDHNAARRVARLFEAGIGGPSDLDRARYWLGRAHRMTVPDTSSTRL